MLTPPSLQATDAGAVAATHRRGVELVCGFGPGDVGNVIGQVDRVDSDLNAILEKRPSVGLTFLVGLSAVLRFRFGQVA